MELETDGDFPLLPIVCIWVAAILITVAGLWFCDFDGSAARNEARQKAFNTGKAEYNYDAKSNTDAEWAAREGSE